ncbi:MAG: DUF1840 domain-containing protein [Pseudomonadota bacterium]
MLIEFKTEHDGSLVLFGKVATQLLEMMGTSGRDQGALRAEDLPAALDRLKAALSQRPDNDETEPDTDEDEADSVSINRRAVPVLDLLERCVASGGYFMWQEKR